MLAPGFAKYFWDAQPIFPQKHIFLFLKCLHTNSLGAEQSALLWRGNKNKITVSMRHFMILPLFILPFKFILEAGALQGQQGWFPRPGNPNHRQWEGRGQGA
jgi:hypothetical protein